MKRSFTAALVAGGMLAASVSIASAATIDFSNALRAEAEYTLDNIKLDEISPVPLPAGAWLLLSALGGLGFMGWRRRRA